MNRQGLIKCCWAIYGIYSSLSQSEAYFLEMIYRRSFFQKSKVCNFTDFADVFVKFLVCTGASRRHPHTSDCQNCQGDGRLAIIHTIQSVGDDRQTPRFYR